MSKVGRNDPCPCGSGQKYKKCCGQSNLVTFSNEVVREELNQLIGKYQDYIFDEFPNLIPNKEPSDDMESIKLFYEFFMPSLIDTQKNGKTIMETFVEREVKLLKRPATISALKEWQDPVIGIFEFKSSLSNEVVEMKNLFNQRNYRILTESIATDEFKPTLNFIGVLLNWGLNEYHFMPIGMPGPPNLVQQIKSEIGVKNLSQGYTSFINSFMYYYKSWMESLEQPFDPVDALSEDPHAIRVIMSLDESLKEEIDHETFESLKVIWSQYYFKYRPKINKPAVYAASLEYVLRQSPFLDHYDPDYTQKEIARKYNVSPNSISKKAFEIEEVLDEMIENVMDMDNQSTSTSMSDPTIASERVMYEASKRMSDETFENEDDLSSFFMENMNEPYQPKDQSEKAQLLIYDALESNDVITRKNLIEQALELNPNNIDGLILKAEDEAEEDIETKTNLLNKAINIGKSTLDLEELKRLEHPWAMIEARPWFRSIHALATLYEEQVMYDKAISLYEDLLKWNPDDNQGVRYHIVPLYIEMEQYQKAQIVLEQYQEQSVNWLLNQALISYLQGQPIKDVKQYVREADRLNPHAIPLLKDPSVFDEAEPQFFSPGSYEEAVLYALNMQYLWFDHLNLLENI